MLHDSRISGRPFGAHARRIVISPDRKRARRGPSASTSAPLASTPATLPVTVAPSGNKKPHGLPLVGVAVLPFGSERRETLVRIQVEDRAELREQRRQQPVAVDRRRPAPGDGGEIGDRHRNVLPGGRRNPHVEPDADDRRRRAEGIAVQLDQDAADLQMAMDQVVGPLERHVLETLGLERSNDGNADGERQPGEKPRALLELPP